MHFFLDKINGKMKNVNKSKSKDNIPSYHPHFNHCVNTIIPNYRYVLKCLRYYGYFTTTIYIYLLKKNFFLIYNLSTIIHNNIMFIYLKTISIFYWIFMKNKSIETRQQ